MFYLILALIILLIIFIVIQAKQYKQFFEKWGIPHPEEIPFIGFFGMFFIKQEHMNDIARQLYNLNKNAKYVGCRTFFAPSIVVRDPELIKSVLVKNFDYFSDLKKFVDEDSDPLFGKNLSFLSGDRWKEVRTLLSPSFTSSKLRTMFDLMSSCADNYSKQIKKNHTNVPATDMKDIFNRYTNDVIATCAFGIEVDSLKNPENDFFTHGRSSTDFSTDFSTMFKLTFMTVFPSLSKKLKLRVISKEDTDFFVDVISTTMRVRDERGITRPDMLQLMMDARGKGQNTKLDLLEITAQAFVFFLGGLGTTSDTMCMIFYELAVNYDVQKKLHAEIDDVMKQCNGKPTYEAVNNMPYLDSILSETLRMHPIGLLTRLCTKEFEFPPALPNSKPFLITPGMEVVIPVAGIHEDADYYENPSKFDPERQADKKSVTSDSMTLGFGMGPRVCIGNRFAALEIKVLMVHLLAKCSIEPCQKTCIPLEYDKNNFMPAVKGGCWLKIKQRN